jgi:hypothetical protein
MRRILGHPVLALVLALVLTAVALIWPGTTPVGIALLVIAFFIVLIAIGEWRGWSLRNPVVRRGGRDATLTLDQELRQILADAFPNEAFRPADLFQLVLLLTHYRHEPWRALPAVEILEDAAGGRWYLSLMRSMPIGVHNYAVAADGRKETLEKVVATLTSELIPKVCNWDAWHAK